MRIMRLQPVSNGFISPQNCCPIVFVQVDAMAEIAGDFQIVLFEEFIVGPHPVNDAWNFSSRIFRLWLLEIDDIVDVIASCV